MRKWLAAALLTTLSAASCLNVCQSETKNPRVPAGFSVLASESRTLNLSRDGSSFELAFETPDIAVRSLVVHAKDAEGKLTIQVVLLSGQPDEIDPSPGRDVYQYLQIAQEDLDRGGLESVTITFTVRKDWIQSNGYDESQIALERYADV